MAHRYLIHRGFPVRTDSVLFSEVASDSVAASKVLGFRELHDYVSAGVVVDFTFVQQCDLLAVVLGEAGVVVLRAPDFHYLG